MNSSSDRSLPPILTDKLTDFRRRVRVVKFTEGILAGLFGLALSWLLVFILDRLGETPAWLRGALLLAGAAVPGLGLPLLWHRWVWRQRRLEDVARLVRRAFPRLGDQLLGIVELARESDGAVSGRSERLVQAAIAQAADAVKDRDLSAAVPNPRRRGWAFAAGSLAALAMAAGFLVPEAARNAAARWLMPWRDTDRYTFAQVDGLPKTLVVPYAEPFDLPATLKDETRWTPGSGTARIPGQPKIRTEAEDATYPFSFAPQKDDTRIDFAVGDDRERVKLEPRTRPELTALSAKLRLPDYLQYRHEPEIEVRGGAVRLLEGAEVSWIAAASRELEQAHIDGTPQPVADGRLVTDYLPVAGSAELAIDWRDTLGLGPKDPLRLKVEAVKDQAPGIAARRESQEQVVLDTEVVAFDLNVQDDFGIRRVGLEWTALPGQTLKGQAVPAKGEKIAAAGDAELRDLETRATLSAAREGIAPQTIEVRAWAEDFLPGRERTRSASFVLHILDATDHALWLTTQFGKWLEAARETYEREQQLHQTNQELRALSAADLDRPENRRSVAKQAVEEQANAARLDSLNGSGKRLVELGTRNPEFDAERLETWATMLQQLNDIAQKRMPSVAELLKQSSGAAGAKPGDAPRPSDKPGDPPTASAPSDPNTQPPTAAGGPKQPEAPSIKQGGDFPSDPGAPKPVDPNAPPPKPVPSIADNEKGFLDPAKPSTEPDSQDPKKPGGGKLGLPSTTLGAIAGAKPEAPPESEAQEQLDQAITEQRDLLAEFAKVSDQLADLLASLEASTFVKRLKAASRAQMELAKSTTTGTLPAFGLERKALSGAPVVAADDISARARGESETVFTIQSDLAAYATRKPDQRFTGLLEQMKKTQVVKELETVALTIDTNFSGQTISATEYWADTLDRWAEDLVSAAQCSSCKGGSAESLPPEIVLKVMQALRDEMALRDETRELEKSRPAMEEVDFRGKAAPLANSQAKIADHVRGALDDILALPEGGQKFNKEVQLLSLVTEVMREARSILAKPNTGDEAIAAETEAIELLLQTQRMKPPGGGGGGGGDPGGGGTAEFASAAALAGLGPGSDAEAEVTARSVGQATGRAGREFPDEFRTGLDAYFNALEKAGAAN